MHGTGAAVGDFDGDGMLELLISHGESASETLTYYRARAGADNHWLRILPLTQHGAPARGAVVRMTMAAAIGTAGERVHVRAIDAGSGYLCQMEPVAHFGLGNRATVFEVKVSWPDGSELLLSNPAVDRMYRIAHPAVGGANSGEGATNPAVSQFQVTLAVDIDSILVSPAARAAFETDFVQDMAAALGVDESAVRIIDITAGSVAVRFEVAATDGLDVAAVLHSAQPTIAGAAFEFVAAVSHSEEAPPPPASRDRPSVESEGSAAATDVANAAAIVTPCASFALGLSLWAAANINL